MAADLSPKSVMVFQFCAQICHGVPILRLSLVSHQVDELVGGEGVGGVGAFEERVAQITLGVVELDDLLLDGVGGDEATDGDWWSWPVRPITHGQYRS